MKESKQTSTEREWVNEWVSDDSACSYIQRAKVCEWINFMRSKISKKTNRKIFLIVCYSAKLPQFCLCLFFRLVGRVKICVCQDESHTSHTKRIMWCVICLNIPFFSAGMAQYCSFVVCESFVGKFWVKFFIFSSKIQNMTWLFLKSMIFIK